MLRLNPIMFLLTAFSICLSCTKKGGTSSDTQGSQPSPSTFNVAVSTIAGKAGAQGDDDGKGVDARFWNPTKMVYDNRNQMLYVADGTVIRKIDAQNNVSTYMPLGMISNWSEIMDMTLAQGAGGSLYIITSQHELLQIQPDGNSVKKTVLAEHVYGGNEIGPLNSGDHFDGVKGLATGANGEIYFFNSFWNTLRRIRLTSLTPPAGTVESFVGKPLTSRSGEVWPFSDGVGDVATFNSSVPDITSDKEGTIYVADDLNNELRVVTPDGHVSSLLHYRKGVAFDEDGAVGVAEADRVTQVACSEDGSMIYFSTYGKGGWEHSPCLRVVVGKKQVYTLVKSTTSYGDGTGDNASFDTIGGLAATPDGKVIYVSEPFKKVIRKVVLQ